MNNKNDYLEHFYECSVVNPDKSHVTEILTIQTNAIQGEEISPGFNHCKAASLTAFALHYCCCTFARLLPSHDGDFLINRKQSFN